MNISITKKEHELMLNSIKDHAIFFMDQDGYIKSWNTGAEILKGYKEEEILGKHFRILFLEEDIEKNRPECEMREALKKGIYDEEWWRLKKDGSKFWAHVVLQPVYDEEKKLAGYVKITTDISEQRAVNDLNDFLMHEVSDYALIMLDNEGTIEKWSKSAEKIVGYQEEEIVGKSYAMLHIQPTQKEREEDLKKHLTEALLGRFEIEGWKRKKDGSHFWAMCVMNPLYDEKGFVVLWRDLTNKRAYEQQLRSENALAVSAKQLQRFEFVANHDLKEPVRKITTFAQMLKSEDPEQKKIIQKIIRSCSKVSRLLDDISELSLIDIDKPFERVDLNEILKRALEKLKTIIAERKVVINSSHLPEAPVIGKQMEQLFKHLISNAIKFGPPGRVPEISIEADIVLKEAVKNSLLDNMKHCKEYLRIQVRDNGIGFEQEYSNQIFDLFLRLNGNTEFEGNGLGLAMCKRIAENHGGTLEALSDIGKGSVFVVLIPYCSEGNSVAS